MKAIILMFIVSTLLMGALTGCSGFEAPPRVYGRGDDITMQPSSWGHVAFRLMRIEPMTEYDTSTHTGYSVVMSLNTTTIPIQMNAATGARRSLIDMSLTDGEGIINTVDINFIVEGYITIIRFVFLIENETDIPRRGTLTWDQSPNPISAYLSLFELNIIDTAATQEYETQTEEPQEYETQTSATTDEISYTEEDFIGIWHYIDYSDDFYFEVERMFFPNGEYNFISHFISFVDGFYDFSMVTREGGIYEISGNQIELIGESITIFSSFPDYGEYTEVEHFATFEFDGENLLLTFVWDDQYVTSSYERILVSVIDLHTEIHGQGESPVPAGFPVRYTAFNNTFTFTGYSIGTNDDGNTTITMYGSGYETISFRDRRWAIPAVCAAESGGITYYPVLVSNDVASLIFIFDAYFQPEVITLTNGETGELLISITVNG